MVVGAGLAALTVGAFAQEMKPVGLAVRAGLFMPTDSTTRAGGTGWFAFGVDYKVAEKMNASTGMDRVSVSLDFAAKNNYRVVPLLVNYTRDNGSYYISAGIGVSFSRRPTGMGVEDRARLGYQVSIGHNFETSQFPLFIEGRFLGNEKAELNGFGVYAGVRF